VTLFPSDGYTHTVWIGLNNRTTSGGTLRWEGTDEPLMYDYWCTPERFCDPSTDGASETCVAFFASGGSPGYIEGLWFPLGCSIMRTEGMGIEYDCPPSPA
jgi:hypothetical protein